LEGDDGADVAKHGVFERGFVVAEHELADVLVRHGQVQTVFARFGEDGCEGFVAKFWNSSTYR